MQDHVLALGEALRKDPCSARLSDVLMIRLMIQTLPDSIYQHLQKNWDYGSIVHVRSSGIHFINSSSYSLNPRRRHRLETQHLGIGTQSWQLKDPHGTKLTFGARQD